VCAMTAPLVGDFLVLTANDLDALVVVLRASGRRVIGPTVRDGAIVHGEISSVGDLPVGWGDEQDGGRYRLVRRDDAMVFGFSSPSESWKRYLFPPQTLMVRAIRTSDGFEVESPEPRADPIALLGVRSCDLHAIALQDRVFLQGLSIDPVYRSRRAGLFIVAVNCSTPASTCFCASMETGPRADAGFDLALTELIDATTHTFVVEVGSTAGAEMLAKVPHTEATDAHRSWADEVVANATAAMVRHLDRTAPRRAAKQLDHPRWDDVADRCLACGNCTMVCPTCFCSSTEDHSSVSGDEAERWRRWDSCFSLEFSNLHGGAVRSSVKARYRQWLLHKLVTWEDQFGSSGCVGCGRCISWCPVGIDLTAEIAALAEQWKESPREIDP
jgi:sulfhydrogenase subunit beta (sulfur reductase)